MSATPSAKAPARPPRTITPRAAKAWARTLVKARAARAAKAGERRRRIAEYQADIQPAVVQRYQSGMGCTGIAQSLNAAGYRTRLGRPFYALAVRKILERAGVYRCVETDTI